MSPARLPVPPLQQFTFSTRITVQALFFQRPSLEISHVVQLLFCQGNFLFSTSQKAGVLLSRQLHHYCVVVIGDRDHWLGQCTSCRLLEILICIRIPFIAQRGRLRRPSLPLPASGGSSATSARKFEEFILLSPSTSSHYIIFSGGKMV